MKICGCCVNDCVLLCIHTLPLAAMSGHRSTVELLLSMEVSVSTALGVDVNAWLRDGEQRLQAWNEKYSERKPAVDSTVSVAEAASQIQVL